MHRSISMAGSFHFKILFCILKWNPLLKGDETYLAPCCLRPIKHILIFSWLTTMTPLTLILLLLKVESKWAKGSSASPLAARTRPAASRARRASSTMYCALALIPDIVHKASELSLSLRVLQLVIVIGLR
jgi:hypothetical protein